jgi:hypothetical protein
MHDDVQPSALQSGNAFHKRRARAPRPIAVLSRQQSDHERKSDIVVPMSETDFFLNAMSVRIHGFRRDA